VSTYRLEREQVVPRRPAEVFPFFAEARNLEALTPPWLRFQVLTPEPIEMRAGTLIRDCVRYALPLGPIGAVAHAVLVRRDLARVFDYRRDAVVRLLG
jgi:ligand-binding SRPBCC domain-containing protein